MRPDLQARLDPLRDKGLMLCRHFMAAEFTFCGREKQDLFRGPGLPCLSARPDIRFDGAADIAAFARSLPDRNREGEIRQ